MPEVVIVVLRTVLISWTGFLTYVFARHSVEMLLRCTGPARMGSRYPRMRQHMMPRGVCLLVRCPGFPDSVDPATAVNINMTGAVQQAARRWRPACGRRQQRQRSSEALGPCGAGFNVGSRQRLARGRSHGIFTHPQHLPGRQGGSRVGAWLALVPLPPATHGQRAAMHAPPGAASAP